MKFATLAASAVLLSSGAVNAKAFGSIVFVQPTGTAVGNQTIPVDVTFTIDPASEALTTGPNAQVTSGLSDADIAAAGYDPTVYTDRIINTAFECSGTFTAGCGSTTAGAYHFEFNFTPPSLIGPANLDIEPGQSFTYNFGRFVPNGGAAPAGTYTFYNVIPEFEISNSDFSQVQFIRIAQSCPGQNPACAFTRTVTAAPAGGTVPEPAAWALMLAGFGTVGAALRRRSGQAMVAA